MLTRRGFRILAGLWAAGLLLCAALVGPAEADQASGRRIALVIGNGDYRNVPPLANPANDARLIAATLKEAGFTLIGNGPQTDLDKTLFDRAVQAFGKAIAGADIAAFYYSGHGMQVAGENWLIPVDANPESARDLDFQMVSAGLVLKQMEGAGTKLNVIILDACRNNPLLSRGIRASGGGLAEMQAPEGTLISYATQPGNVALDGTGGDSPYTVALSKALKSPGLDVFRVFNQVGLAVKAATAGAQQPWLASSPIAGDLYIFNGPVTVVTQGAAPPPAPAAPPPAAPAPTSRFDGVWDVVQTCPTEGVAAGYTHQFAAEVKGGTLHAQHGVVGQPGSLVLDGTLGADGSGLLDANGRTGNPRFNIASMQDASPGTQYFYKVDVHFDGAKGTGTRLGAGRTCQFLFDRRR